MPFKSEKQRRFLMAVAKNPVFAARVKIPQAVGRKFENDVQKYAGGGKVGMLTTLATKLAEAATPVKEQKMLQGMYRGYAGDYNTAKAAQDSGLVYATPQRAAAEAYAKNRSKQAARRGVDSTPHMDMLLVDPFVGRRYGHSTLGSGEQGPIRTLAGEYTPEQIGDVTNLYAEGGRVGMEHTRSSGQDASTQPLSGSALKALVRGWIAGTAGIPGDVEELARKGINWSFGPGGVKVDEQPILRNTEGFKQSLPGKQPGDEALGTAGSLFGGFGVPQAARGIKGALTLLANAPRAPMAGSRAAQQGVIKAPGGNWLSGSVEDALKGLKQGKVAFGDPYTPEQVLEMENYFKANPGREGSTLNAMGAAELADAKKKLALNTWIDKKLANYVRNDMATERDPIRALAEQGPIHFDPTANAPLRQHTANRKYTGNDLNGLGQSTVAKGWEDLTDASIHPQTVGDYLNPGYLAPKVQAAHRAKNLGPDPWMGKVSEDTMAYKPELSLARSAGFDHLIDELRNAVDVNSGLPPQLRLKPEDLAKVSVPQAVQRVAQINQWRAEQKAAADLARANNAATVLHKDYPEKGYKWVELKKGEQLPEGWSEELVDTPLGKLKKLRDPKTGGLTATDPREEALRDALKYEGDTMGHCVGGYCDDVASGRTKIYSLRDDKGQPHVTIEVQPKGAVFSDVAKHIGREEADRLLDQGVTLSEMIKGIPDFKYPESIIQIKGKHNRKPKDEYLPFVQDFVRSGKWSDVGDFQNAGLIKRSNLLQKEQELMPELGDYLTLEEIQAMRKGQPWTPIDTDPEFAEGGPVKAPTWEDAFNKFNQAHREQYGIGIDRAWNKDPDAEAAKQRIDDEYTKALQAYNEQTGEHLTPDQSVLGVNAQPNAYVPKPDRGGWLSQQLSNVGNIFRPVVQSVDDFGKDVRKAAGDTVGSAAQLGSEATGGVLSPDAVKVAAAVAYLMSTGDVAGAEKVAETSGLSAAELALSEAPTFAFTPEIASSLNTSIFQSPFITGTSGATMSDAVMASLTGNGGQLGLNAANIGQSADQILNAARLQDFLAANTRGLVENTAAGFAGPVGGPALNFGKMVSGGMPLDVAATKAVGSVALGKAVQEAAKQTGVPAPVLSLGVSGKAPAESDLAKAAISVYNQQNMKSRQSRRA